MLEKSIEDFEPTQSNVPAVMNSESESEKYDTTRMAPVHLTGSTLILVFGALLLSVFLVNLDQTIVATALPRIVSVFDALNLDTWVAAAYFLTNAGLMLSVGQLVKTIPIKTVYLASIVLFEIGSALCGAVGSIMGVLIFGRAVAGCGAAGITICAIATIANFTRLEDRPVLFACFGALLAIASIVGPLLGGAFTDHVSWRWCFYINLPIGAISMVAMFLWLPYRKPSESHENQSLFSRFNLMLDWIGTLLVLGFATCLLLGLQWGGAVKPWASGAVIAPLCISGVIVVLFVAWEGHRGMYALVPYFIFRRYSQIGSCLEGFWLMTALITAVYYLPLWYQINGRSSEQSGIDILPLMISFVVMSGVGSGVITATGRYWHLLFALPLVSVAGSALLYTIEGSTSSAKLIGYQILLGCGLGCSTNSTYVAVQADWADEVEETTRASTILSFVSTFGGIIGLSIAGVIYDNRLDVELATVPDLSPELLAALKQSVTLISTLPTDIRQEVIDASVRALRPVFLIPLVCAALRTLSSCLIRNHDMRERGKLASAGTVF